MRDLSNTRAGMPLIDIGANLTHESFSHDRETVVREALAAGVTRFGITGTTVALSEQAVLLARAQPDLMFATAGVHPHHARDVDADAVRSLSDLAALPEVRAVGETGLDYFRDLAPRPVQIKAFERQIAIAVACGKPLFLHQREAHEDFLAVMKAARDSVTGGVVHCFTDSREALFAYLDLDLHIGITGWLCDERRGAHLRELVRHIPAERLLVETDSPYLMPRTLVPKPAHRRNEPKFLPHIVEELARDRGEAFKVTAASTTAAARTLFNL